MKINTVLGYRVGLLFCLFLAVSAFISETSARTIQFSGYNWIVRPNQYSGPGSNFWSENNVWLDTQNHLHLRLTNQNGTWYCPQVQTEDTFGFGRYSFSVTGPIDVLSKNVVFGLFLYPLEGLDYQHEIDIEFARGYEGENIGNYTVWPAVLGVSKGTDIFHLNQYQGSRVGAVLYYNYVTILGVCRDHAMGETRFLCIAATLLARSRERFYSITNEYPRRRSARHGNCASR